MGKNATLKKSNELSSTQGGLKSVNTSNDEFQIKKDVLEKIYDSMAKARMLEERLIKMYKQSDGYFWIGGPGEEAFNIPLGMLLKKGQGKDYDYLHLHYRSSAILLAMGAQPVDSLRQMKNTALDPYSGGRNFSNHYSVYDWNVIPVASTIETQYQTAIGTAIAQKRHGGDGITIVNGGDAGTAEGDFASCLVWASRPANPLPMLIIVTNNGFGISTPSQGQHGEKTIADRAKAFGIQSKVVNGNDVEESYFAIKEAMDYIRKERKPYFIESQVSRLFGHSSASGANFVSGEVDCLNEFEKRLVAQKVMTESQMKKIKADYEKEFLALAQQVKTEPMPDPSTIYDYTYWNQKGKYW
ncbi:MAG: 3-methyl-2-oxobutanoate dehydrogenase [Bdellovibrionaceae bacterium]|nr:3-methyl-2-oxobutanoate dehydrogenase [Pseudobdellovibrionaceae bacterium]|tara:strand:+ start:2594 stop:3661 length:1068 start_codon:yes stop_codon:yes gene_type:complete